MSSTDPPVPRKRENLTIVLLINVKYKYFFKKLSSSPNTRCQTCICFLDIFPYRVALPQSKKHIQVWPPRDENPPFLSNHGIFLSSGSKTPYLIPKNLPQPQVRLCTNFLCASRSLRLRRIGNSEECSIFAALCALNWQDITEYGG